MTAAMGERMPAQLSVGSTGRSDCPGVRKSVRLDLDASPVVLQVSGVAPDTIAVTIGAVE